MNVCNKTYDVKFITLGDLPAVIDDQKIANQTIKMLGILPENTFEFTDATSDELDEIIDWLQHRIAVLTRILQKNTGLFGIENYGQGILWETLRPFAMKLVAPFDCI